MAMDAVMLPTMALVAKTSVAVWETERKFWTNNCPTFPDPAVNDVSKLPEALRLPTCIVPAVPLCTERDSTRAAPAVNDVTVALEMVEELLERFSTWPVVDEKVSTVPVTECSEETFPDDAFKVLRVAEEAVRLETPRLLMEAVMEPRVLMEPVEEFRTDALSVAMLDVVELRLLTVPLATVRRSTPSRAILAVDALKLLTKPVEAVIPVTERLEMDEVTETRLPTNADDAVTLVEDRLVIDDVVDKRLLMDEVVLEKFWTLPEFTERFEIAAVVETRLEAVAFTAFKELKEPVPTVATDAVKLPMDAVVDVR
jgi:hypothetical protein